MRIAKFETFLANAGLRNYLFVRLTTDTGLTGVGEATLEWQEKTVQTLCHEWVEGRILRRDPFDIEHVIGGMIRDQYQGGSTVMTAISAVEIAMWDIMGKACGQPVYRLLGGRCHARIPAYANGWYGGAQSPKDYADRAQDVVARGYRALKFDPFGTAWKETSSEEAETAIEIVAAIREAVGQNVGLMIEFHGRLSAGCALKTIRNLERFDPVWCEEPVAPENLELLAEVKRQVKSPISAGERLYTLSDFSRLSALRAVDVIQMDISHCGGILMSKKIAAMGAAQDQRVSPHCSIGPVALAACLHFDVSTPNFMIQEAFAEFDVPWRSQLVRGWNPIQNGEFLLPDTPGLGLEIDEEAIALHPYVQNSFPSLWDGAWVTQFTQTEEDIVCDHVEDRFMQTFRLALTGDFLNEAGSSAYGDIGLGQLDEAGCIEYHFLMEHAPRAHDPGYWSRLYSLEVAAEQIAGIDGLIVLRPWIKPSTFANGAGDLVVIGRSGAGYDKIDVEACTDNDVALFNAPLALNHSTASSALMFMLALAKRLRQQDRVVRTGRWDQQAAVLGQELQGKTLGIIGLGRSGLELVRLAAPFEMRVLAYSPHADAACAQKAGVRLTTLDDLLQESDFVSLHCRLTPQTRRLLGAQQLALMKPSAFLINIARGELVDQAAMVAALSEGRLAGAGLDVFDVEPLPKEDPLTRLDNVILAPHWSCSTADIWIQTGRAMSHGMLRAARGQVPENVVNQEVLDRPRFRQKLSRFNENVRSFAEHSEQA